jgi:stage V sporulation protein B
MHDPKHDLTQEVRMGAPEASRDASVVRTAGRGFLFITGAKLFFIASGYAIHFLLPVLLGTKELYGTYGLVASLLNVLTTVVVQATIQSVSKLVSEDESHAPDVRRAALRLQVLVGGGIAVVYFAASGLIADLFSSGRLAAIGAQSVDDPASLAMYFRVSSGVVLAYAFYATLIGVLNGTRRFGRQALFDVSYASLKTVGVVGAAAAGLSVLGVFSGMAAAAGVILIVAVVVVGVRGGTGGHGYEGRLARFMLPVMAYTLVLSLLLTVDLWVLKGLGPPGMGDTLGDYTAAQTLSRIPYQAMLSVTFVVFPLVSRSTFEGDRAATASYITTTLRYSLIVLAAMVSIIAGAASDVIAVPYGDAYRTAAPMVVLLSSGMLAFAIFNIMCTILNGCGRTGLALALGATTLAADVALCLALVPSMGASGAATATLTAMLGGVVLATGVLWRLFRASIPIATLLRVALASAAVVGVASALPRTGRLATIAWKCELLVVVYLGVLFVAREITRGDIARVREVFARRAASPSEGT